MKKIILIGFALMTVAIAGMFVGTSIGFHIGFKTGMVAYNVGLIQLNASKLLILQASTIARSVRHLVLEDLILDYTPNFLVKKDVLDAETL